MPPKEEFQTTIWTQVLNARDADDTHSREALENLCRLYWYPIYSYVRRRCYAFHDAQDLTQGFFSELLAKDYLQQGQLKRRSGSINASLKIARIGEGDLPAHRPHPGLTFLRYFTIHMFHTPCYVAARKILQPDSSARSMESCSADANGEETKAGIKCINRD